ncbi:hypothetical protein GCM10009096_19500 [Parasphingorhabdus litoris]|uniref:DUF3299 domain-containing protein n=1 Tax=Parasphingorhabdus litoris TaxID=394733 RepID=A0ABN1AJ02_9SPHN|nr:DUF3299 domain-containing protein [Parasphingorhabdus litoris]
MKMVGQMIKISFAALICTAPLSGTATQAAMQDGGKAPIEDIWKPAATPKGGVSWKTLEATGEKTRKDKQGYIRSKPIFTPRVKELAGKRIKVAGWMMPLQNSATQKNFVLLAYPPGCPFHFHAAPNQFIEIYSDVGFPTNEQKMHVISGVLELTGQDESGIFYRLRKARPG